MNAMSKKSKKAFLFSIALIASSAVWAAVEPKPVVVFYLPAQNDAEVHSVHQAVTRPIKTGLVDSGTTMSLPKPNAIQEKHGIITSSDGVSLYDKGNVPLAEAEQNILYPAKVLILPPENLQTKAKAVKGTPPSVNPVPLRIFPLTKPAADIKKALSEGPIKVQYEPLRRPPPDIKNERPTDEIKWGGWALMELRSCDMDANTVLPTLYWLMQNGKFTGGKNDCEVKAAIAAHLRKCYPWPATYYTKLNNEYEPPYTLQMAVEVLETDFYTRTCSSLDLTHINFAKVEFMAGGLRGDDFSFSNLEGARFEEIDMSDAVFEQSILKRTLFQNVQLSKTYFKDSDITYAHFFNVNAPMSNFEGSDLSNSQFRDSDLSMSSFIGAKFPNTAWRNVKAYGLEAPDVTFAHSEFSNVLLTQLNAPKADFSYISCKNCVFRQARLYHAYFYGANFDYTIFDSAYLERASFEKAVFKTFVSLKEANLHAADFSSVDMSLFDDLALEPLRLVKIDKKTVIPEKFPAFEAASYDEEIFKSYEPPSKYTRYTCSQKMCDDRLLGRVSNQNLAVRSMTILADDTQDLDTTIWALCSMGCIAKHDKKLENSQLDILSYYVRRHIPWDAEKDLFKQIEPIPVDIQMALFVLTDPNVKRDLGHDIDLTNTDLRLADLTNANLINVNFAGSHLGGADMRGAKTDRAYEHFNNTVIDEYTIFPIGMTLFKPFMLPDSIYPSWWKPKTVRIIRDGSNPWAPVTEDVPFSDDLVVPKEENSTVRAVTETAQN